jgi:hypothetical protein
MPDLDGEMATNRTYVDAYFEHMIKPIGIDYAWTDTPKATTWSNDLYVRYDTAPTDDTAAGGGTAAVGGNSQQGVRSDGRSKGKDKSKSKNKSKSKSKNKKRGVNFSRYGGYSAYSKQPWSIMLDTLCSLGPECVSLLRVYSTYTLYSLCTLCSLGGLGNHRTPVGFSGDTKREWYMPHATLPSNMTHPSMR